jgi:hypothetical protein
MLRARRRYLGKASFSLLPGDTISSDLFMSHMDFMLPGETSKKTGSTLQGLSAGICMNCSIGEACSGCAACHERWQPRSSLTGSTLHRAQHHHSAPLHLLNHLLVCAPPLRD